MKIIVSLFLLILSVPAFSWEVQENWSNDYNQEVLINCDSQEKICTNICQDPYQCNVSLNSCKNCIGTGILLSYFYQEVGKWFMNSGVQIPDEQFVKLLQSRNIVLLTHDSPYNIFTPINDMGIERAFNSLCPEKFDSFPVVVGELDKGNELARISAVVCHGTRGAKVYKINTKPQVEINLKHLRLLANPH